MMPESTLQSTRLSDIDAGGPHIKQDRTGMGGIEQVDIMSLVALNYIAIRELIAIAIAGTENSVIRLYCPDKPWCRRTAAAMMRSDEDIRRELARCLPEQFAFGTGLDVTGY